MRKRIGLFMGEADCQYDKEFIPFIFEEAKRYDYDVFVFGNYGTYDKNLTLYSDGEATVFKIPDFETFDGIIVEESQFNIPGMEKELYKHLGKEANDVPVIYLKAVKDKYKSVLASDKDAIRTVTEHFIKDHHFTKICHMAGRRELSDALDRMQGYIEAMESAGLKVKSNMIYWGDYWYNKAGEALDTFLDGTDDYPEAIVCANDFMAIAMVRELQRRGKKVPEDVCVSGYDNTDDGKLLEPPLTTIEVPRNEMAILAVNMIHNIKKGKKIPKIQYTSSRMKLTLRDSCGCEHFDGQQNLANKLRYIEKHNYGMDMCVCLENSYHTAFDEEDIYSTADAYFKYNQSDTGYVCLCTDAFNANKRPVDKVSEYTDEMILKRIFYPEEDKRYGSPGTVFKRSAILPDECFDTKEPGLYFVYPVHSLNRVYGYTVMCYSEKNWVNKFTQAYTQSLGGAIDNYNIRSEYMDMVEMKKMYLMDELTKLNNRRGFEQQLQTLMDRAKRKKLFLTLVSIDMDGLKYINDNYGHLEGDFGLQTIADVIRSCLAEGEAASRNGGDEFAAILISEDKRRYLQFEAEFADALTGANKKANRPYVIHASLGMCVVDNLDTSILTYMEKADERMYSNKQKYKELHPEMKR